MGCQVPVVPAACEGFAEKFFEQLGELDSVEDALGALAEYERRYGGSRGIDLLRADLKERFGRVEQELKDRLHGIAECARREGGEIEL